MNYKSLTDLEENLIRTGSKGEYDFRRFAIPLKNENLTLNGLFTTPRGRAKYYYAVEYPKQRIVLHFTAGQIRSDLGALTRNDYHVSVAFVIGRSGIIYQLFSSKFFSGHIGLGIGNIRTGNAQDKITIGIELSNYGFLTEKDGNLETYYSRPKDKSGNPGPADIYCSLTDKEAYKKIDAPFRQQSYYATFTEEQYDSLVILLRYLTAQYNIPRQFLPEPVRYVTNESVLSFKGIVSHINYRVNGKWDIGPGFEWQKVIDGVQAKTYTPLFGNFENTGDGITSEDELAPYLPEPIDPLLESEPYEELPNAD